MDAFFASVEQHDTPSLRGQPVVVGGSPETRGVVAACSYEARRYGIHSAMSCRKAIQLCPHAIFTKPRMHRYKEVSNIIMEVFRQYTELVEPLSVDEAFLDVTENKKGIPSASHLAEIIRNHIYYETGLTASAGVSYNKFLAKAASATNKPNGMHVIPPEKALHFLDNLAIGKFHGVGKVTEQKMLQLGIQNGYDLRQRKKEDLLFHFGKSGAYFHSIAWGIDHRPVKTDRIRKSISNETTLAEDTLDVHLIGKIIGNLAEKTFNSLLLHRKIAFTLTLKVRYYDFTTITRSVTRRTPLESVHDILQQMQYLIRTTEIGRKKVRLLGVGLAKLLSSYEKKPIQLKLPFDKLDK